MIPPRTAADLERMVKELAAEQIVRRKLKIRLLIVASVAYAIGYGLVVWRVDWWTALALFLLAFGNNVEGRIK